MKKLLTLAALVAAFSLLIATWPAEPARAAANIPLGMMHQFMLPQTAASVSTGFTADRLNKFTTAPGCPVAGYLFYDTTADTVKACNNALSAAVIGTSLPAMSDNGTVVTSTEVFRGPAGAVSGPTYSFTGGTSTGMYLLGGELSFARAGSDIFGTDGAVLAMANGSPLAWSSGAATSADTFIYRVNLRSLRMGLAANATPLSQIFQLGEDGSGADKTGGSATLKPGIGTGAGAGTKFVIQRNLMAATSSTAQAFTDGFVVGESKTLSNTTAQTTALVNISVPSNSSGGSSGSINVSCNDGTNFDSETVTFFVSYVNKATVLTIGTVQLGTPSTANNSGSCTTAVTATAGTNSVNINVTPVITTIVPTTTTGTVLSLSSYATGNVTVN